MKVYLNGKLVPERQARISVFDHGLLYGDGVFEGIRTYNGRVFMLDEHIARLYRSAKAIALEIPMTPAAIRRAVLRTCLANRTRNGYVRLVVTRGCGTLGLNPYHCSRPQVFIIAASIQLYPNAVYEKGLTMVTVPTRRNHTEAINPAIKGLNYLNNVLAKIEALKAGAQEGLFLNPEGFVAEATGENVFAVRGSAITTPPLWAGALDGVTRGVVMRLAAEAGYTVREAVLTRYDLYTADEMFLSGTAAEVVGVVSLDGRSIGAGVPGPVTQTLAKRFRQYAMRTGVPIR